MKCHRPHPPRTHANSFTKTITQAIAASKIASMNFASSKKSNQPRNRSMSTQANLTFTTDLLFSSPSRKRIRMNPLPLLSANRHPRFSPRNFNESEALIVVVFQIKSRLICLLLQDCLPNHQERAASRVTTTVTMTLILQEN